MKESSYVKSKNLFMIFHGRFPSEKAASIFVAQSAEAYAQENISVTLVVPRRYKRSKLDPYSYYNVEKNFKVVFLPTIDLLFFIFPKVISFYISFFCFSVACFFYFIFKVEKEDVIYSNETLPLFFTSFVFRNTFYEMHDFPESKLPLFSIFLKRMCFILIHNKWKIRRLHELFKIDQSKILYEPNAVDIKKFDTDISKSDARDRLSLPYDKKIAVYTGHLYTWKGVDILAEASKNLPENTITVFVGGTDIDVLKFKKKYSEIKNILIVGNRPHKEIPLWQKAADVLVLPNTEKEDISKYYTSPMKLFEYMASKRPIIASRIPSITEILNDKNAILISPDNSKILSDTIIKVCNDFEREGIINRAYDDVREHSWQKRARRILNFTHGF